MTFEDFIKILLSGGSITLGAFLAAIRSKLSSSNESNNRWHYVFYVLSLIVIGGAVYAVVRFRDIIFSPNWLAIIVIALSVISSLALMWFTWKHLIVKQEYSTSELDPIVNEFTKNADRNLIRLFGGDLNFFGNTPQLMDGNSQYNVLKSVGFKEVEILCEEPPNIQAKIRYGKIMNDMPNVAIKFYNPKNADLLIRGRMKTLQGVTHLLIYTKEKSGLYRALETDTSNANGALYNNIWNLAWSLARPLEPKERKEFTELSKN